METLVELSEQSTDELHPRQHGAHTECQTGLPFVTLTCGVVADWDDEADGEGLIPCPMCWDVARCPICGVRLVSC